jgi:hypothetical protein
MLERIDRDLDPFEGMSMTIFSEKKESQNIANNNTEIENVVEELDSP